MMLRLKLIGSLPVLNPTRSPRNMMMFARGQSGESLDSPRTSLPKIRLRDDNTGAFMTVPGLTTNDIDRAGNMSIWKAARIGEAGRLTICTQKPYNQLLDDRLMFLVSSQFSFQSAYYSRTHYYNPIVIDSQLVNIGNSSYAFQDKYISQLTSELLWTGFHQIACVGKQSRRPESIPEDVRAIFEGNIRVDNERITRKELPDNTRCVSQQVLWSDADLYLHCNHASYLKFCHDAATVLSKQGHFTHLHGDLAFQKIHTCKGLFLDETLPEQTIDVHVWEDPEEEFTLLHDVQCERKSVFQCSFKFFKPTFAIK